MDLDEWDDEIADEDLINALTQASQPGSGRNETTVTAHYGAVPLEESQMLDHVDNLDLDGLPSGAFDSSPDRPRVNLNAPPPRTNQSQSFRQTTLWGQTIESNEAPQTQVQSKRVYRADMPTEPPTQHKLDHEALKTWVYPTNLGPTRDYQFSIVRNGLFNNTLVALPTGLGKTFIAATVMLNYYRWTKHAKIIFVAPTKPLASQQVEACLNVAGIPRSDATLLTGEIAPSLREGEWEKKRLFFMTPQTLQNDLSKGYADPKSVVLLVVDEAHRATGDYAYVKVIEFLRRFNQSFRVLALTATPGSTVEGVQEVIDSLGISNIEIRTEESIDIRQFVHAREVDQVVLEASDEMQQIQDLFSKTLRPLCNKLAQVNKWLARDPMTLTVMGLREAQRQWFLGAGKHANQGTKGMIMAVFTILQSLAHAIKLLNFHGIAPFYHKMLDFRSDVEAQGSKGSKYKKQVIGDENFQEMMDTIDKWQRLDGFVGHPKLSYLCENLLNHFMDAANASGTRVTSTRAIVFSEYRDSAEEIVRTLNKHKPMIKASIFVGQADSKRSEGMKQKQQIETIERFRNGDFNVLVATSIGEEGLDIGQVDLIICYDASASPIRMLQRMGRTGRKRAGNITLLLMKGKEEEQFKKAKDNYEKMQRFICDGSRFNFRNDLSSRIIPREARPEVDMRMVEIPIENTQDPSLPEPKRGRGALRKKATQKKFHMPDGVITGFVKASDFGRPGTKSKPTKPVEVDILADVPPLSSVLLDRRQTEELDHSYRNLPSLRTSQEDITGPDLTAYPKAQRRLGPVVILKHGFHTKRCVKLFRRLAKSQSPMERHVQPYSEDDRLRYKDIPCPEFADVSAVYNMDDLGTIPDKRPLSSLPVRDYDLPPPKRQKKPVPGKSNVVTGRVKNDNPFVNSSEVEESESDSATQKGVSSSQAHSGRLRTKRQSFKKAPRRDDLVEDFGDDCTRTSQLVEWDDSDSGADLVGFINDGPLSSLLDVSSTPTLASSSPPTAKQPARKQDMEKDEPFYQFHLTQSQEGSDGDLLSMSQLGDKMTGRTQKGPDLTESGGEDHDTDVNDDGVQQRVRVSRRKMPVALVEESDYE
ncbi:3'-5' DNA helicase [Gnomoniopsis smithogilvyi]|uniref:ATP-dependent DNA helicase n=1 Tax=Gnomoniopsis smithogilvyi TaxID=1191159 RepID=A0A9W8Z3D0_9PEZI|nr:3'-5' DNA helicase [Gnomoniopsis smithogilvyi]